jgi:putative endonuclease
MYFIYILFSVSAEKYYVGYTNEMDGLLRKHNSQQDFNTYTSKYRPWEIAALFSCGGLKSDAIKIERFIKKQKSRKLIEKLIDPGFIPDGTLAQLVRVPHLRD